MEGVVTATTDAPAPPFAWPTKKLDWRDLRLPEHAEVVDMNHERHIFRVAMKHLPCITGVMESNTGKLVVFYDPGMAPDFPSMIRGAFTDYVWGLMILTHVVYLPQTF